MTAPTPPFSGLKSLQVGGIGLRSSNQGHGMRRLSAISVVGALVAMFAWLSAVTAQPALPRIAILVNGGAVEDVAEGRHPRWDALFGELRQLGVVEGQTVLIDRYTAEGQDPEGLARLARTIADAGYAAIVTFGDRLVAALRAATATTPIVAVAGFDGIASIVRPGGNITGVRTIASEGTSRDLQFLHEVAPEATMIGWLGPRSAWDASMGETARASAAQLGLTLVPLLVAEPTGVDEIRAALLPLGNGQIGGLWVSGAAEMVTFAQTVAEMAIGARVPALALDRRFPLAGLLMSYGPDINRLNAQLAHFVDRVLDGANPAEMPIEQPTEFALVLNLGTARALGIAIPQSVMLFATEFIE